MASPPGREVLEVGRGVHLDRVAFERSERVSDGISHGDGVDRGSRPFPRDLPSSSPRRRRARLSTPPISSIARRASSSTWAGSARSMTHSCVVAPSAGQASATWFRRSARRAHTPTVVPAPANERPRGVCAAAGTLRYGADVPQPRWSNATLMASELSWVAKAVNAARQSSSANVWVSIPVRSTRPVSTRSR